MNEKHFDGLHIRMTNPQKRITSYRRTDYLIHPRSLARKDAKGKLLRAIVTIGTMFENFAKNPGLERARARDYHITK